jgi:hypothetical protein
MRNVKYRALAKDGTWRYGEYPSLAPEMGNTHYPMDIFWKHFLSGAFRRETLGQFTGKADRNCKKIYEGDLIVARDSQMYPFEVYWDERDSSYRMRFKHEMQFDKTEPLMWAEHGKIIGNVHENPELIDKKLEREAFSRG